MTRWISGLLLLAWLLLEVVLRDGDEARSWRGGEADRSSTRIIVVTYVAAFVAPFFFLSSGIAVTAADSLLAWIGVAIGAVGLAIRIWSMQVLGRDYTRSLRTRDDQTIVDRGPYRVVRHPGYLGSILVWVGSRLAVNWFVALATLAALLAVYAYRIRAEEQMLGEQFGEQYRTYQARTRRLLPFLW
jgi:protein-S-isoprenylcysteine O-methyltransferase